MEHIRLIKFTNIIILIFTMFLMLSVHYKQLDFFKIFYQGTLVLFVVIAGSLSVLYGIYTMILSFSRGD